MHLMSTFLCKTGNSECVQLMIDRGAQMEAHDCHYGTPLHVACAREHFDCAKVLLSAGEVMFSLVFLCSLIRGSALATYVLP